MKKQQKIIELRREAKLKVAELETKIAFARSEAAKKRASLMKLRADELKYIIIETERFNVIAYYRALFADIQAGLDATVANLKADIQQTKSECEKMCAAAEDDPEPEKEQPQQETVYCDGSEHTARIVARRMINKMPHVPKGGYLFVHIIRDINGEFLVGVSEQGEKQEDYVLTTFSKGDGQREEAVFVQWAREMLGNEEDEDGAKAAGPMSRALDAIFGGNPVEQVDNLISDTVKNGKEGGNE